MPVNPAIENPAVAPRNHPRDTLLRKSRSLGTLARGANTEDNTGRGGVNVQSGTGHSQTQRGSVSTGNRLLSSSRSSTAVRFSGQPSRLENIEEQQDKKEEQGGEEGGLGTTTVPRTDIASTHREQGCDEKVARKMRRGSEMATWAICGTAEKSARDYLW